MTEEKCWLCLRTTPQKISQICHRLFENNSEKAHSLSVQVGNLLKETYLKYPAKISGKKTNTLIGGAIYLFVKEKSQSDIAKVCGVSKLSVRAISRLLGELHSLEAPRRKPSFRYGHTWIKIGELPYERKVMSYERNVMSHRDFAQKKIKTTFVVYYCEHCQKYKWNDSVFDYWRGYTTIEHILPSNLRSAIMQLMEHRKHEVV